MNQTLVRFSHIFSDEYGISKYIFGDNLHTVKPVLSDLPKEW